MEQENIPAVPKSEPGLAPPPYKNYSMAFFDVQNLFRHAKEAFHEHDDDPYHHPSFNPIKLHEGIAQMMGCIPNMTRYYTGIPLKADQPMWGGYWENRLRALSRARVHTTTRQLQYHTETRDGEEVVVAREKGIDVRIALDLVSCTRRKEFDTAIIFSQDQDLAEAVNEMRSIAQEQGRTIIIVSAFPVGHASSRGGIRHASRHIEMDKEFYDSCLDTNDYRPAEFR